MRYPTLKKHCTIVLESEKPPRTTPTMERNTCKLQPLMIPVSPTHDTMEYVTGAYTYSSKHPKRPFIAASKPLALSRLISRTRTLFHIHFLRPTSNFSERFSVRQFTITVDYRKSRCIFCHHRLSLDVSCEIAVNCSKVGALFIFTKCSQSPF
jgi:hypothetical protein